ncbi:MAG: fused MFS/spermidine synthase [Rhodospirillales bacterium]|nr:fused MFS/spermidine synthase [Rhodospirillales bacterium]
MLALYAATVALSALLLFLVQPILAKQILPWFGGAAGVWTACLFFFQTALLAGYAYAHALIRWVPPRRQAFLHLALLGLAALTMPVIASAAWRESAAGAWPSLRVVGLLGATVGLPYLMLASTSPLVQAWFARRNANPYRLFALSNLASLLGLLAYPFLIEPASPVRAQALVWSGLFVLFALLSGASALRAGLDAPAQAQAPEAPEPAAPGQAGVGAWLGLSALGSLLLVAVTAHLTQNIASFPLLWIAPLALYLITFVIVFDLPRPLPPAPIGLLALAFAAAMLWMRGETDLTLTVTLSIPLYLGGLFFACLFLHGELARAKPAPARLTGYYLALAAGGALGSLLGSVLAPEILRSDDELPIALSLVAWAFFWSWRRRMLGLRLLAGLAVIGFCVYAFLQAWEQARWVRVFARNFYSFLKVVDYDATNPYQAVRSLQHGIIEHGKQFLDGDRQSEATSYYGRQSGVGLAMARQRERARGGPLAVGLVGLGAGTLATYGERGDVFTFYEINPQVVGLAHQEFTFLAKSRAKIEVALGDARLKLEREAPRRFALLVIDAFSGDAIPIHLLTREAMAVYRRHLAPGGVLAFHITNRYVDLAPMIARLLADDGFDIRLIRDDPSKPASPPSPEDDADDEARERREGDGALAPTDWVLAADSPLWWQAEPLASRSEAIALVPDQRAWTDDFNDIRSALRPLDWRFGSKP